MDKDLQKVMENINRFFLGPEGEKYSDKVLELAYEPLNVGEMDTPDGLGFLKGECGDSMWIYLKLDGERINKATFLSDGCGPTLACGSSITELVRNRSLREAEALTAGDIITYLEDLPPSHHHCAVLAINTLQKALKDIKK